MEKNSNVRCKHKESSKAFSKKWIIVSNYRNKIYVKILSRHCYYTYQRSNKNIKNSYIFNMKRTLKLGWCNERDKYPVEFESARLPVLQH